MICNRTCNMLELKERFNVIVYPLLVHAFESWSCKIQVGISAIVLSQEGLSYVSHVSTVFGGIPLFHAVSLVHAFEHALYCTRSNDDTPLQFVRGQRLRILHVGFPVRPKRPKLEVISLTFLPQHGPHRHHRILMKYFHI